MNELDHNTIKFITDHCFDLDKRKKIISHLIATGNLTDSNKNLLLKSRSMEDFYQIAFTEAKDLIHFAYF
jgi:hypothetical protein